MGMLEAYRFGRPKRKNQKSFKQENITREHGKGGGVWYHSVRE
jgi:hypothetical protein